MTSSVQTYFWFDDVQQTRMWLFNIIRSLLVCIKHIHKSNFIITWCKGFKFLKDRKDLSVPEHRFIHVVITGVSIPKPDFYRRKTWSGC